MRRATKKRKKKHLKKIFVRKRKNIMKVEREKPQPKLRHKVFLKREKNHNKK